MSTARIYQATSEANLPIDETIKEWLIKNNFAITINNEQIVLDPTKKDEAMKALGCIDGFENYKKIGKWLVENGANVNYFEKEIGGQTLLFVACYWGDLDFVKWLLEHGADVNGPNHAGGDFVHWAAMDHTCRDENSSTELLDLILSHTSEANKKGESGSKIAEYALSLNGCARILNRLAKHGFIIHDLIDPGEPGEDYTPLIRIER